MVARSWFSTSSGSDDVRRTAQNDEASVAVEIGRIGKGAVESFRLFDGVVELLAGIGIRGAFLHTGDLADDGGPWGLHLLGADAQPLADRILARPGLLCQLMVDDDDELGL